MSSALDGELQKHVYFNAFNILALVINSVNTFCKKIKIVYKIYILPSNLFNIINNITSKLVEGECNGKQSLLNIINNITSKHSIDKAIIFLSLLNIINNITSKQENDVKVGTQCLLNIINNITSKHIFKRYFTI